MSKSHSEKEATANMQKRIQDILLMHRNDVLKFDFTDLAKAIMDEFPDSVRVVELEAKIKKKEDLIKHLIKENTSLESEANKLRNEAYFGSLLKSMSQIGRNNSMD